MEISLVRRQTCFLFHAARMAQWIRRAPPKNTIARFESARGCETSFAPPNHQRSLISIAFCRGLLCVLLGSSPIVGAIRGAHARARTHTRTHTHARMCPRAHTTIKP